MATSVIQKSLASDINELNNVKITEVRTTGTVASNGGTGVIAFPQGYTKATTRVVYSFLYINTATPYYVAAVQVSHTDSDGIHVVNNGGAAGTIFVGITKIV